MCKSNGSDPNNLKIFKAKEENRLCFKDGSCHRVGKNDDLGFGEWSPWSSCTATCKRTRTRTCLAANELDGNSCVGPTVEYETCEMATCDCKFKMLFRRSEINH